MLLGVRQLYRSVCRMIFRDALRDIVRNQSCKCLSMMVGLACLTVSSFQQLRVPTYALDAMGRYDANFFCREVFGRVNSLLGEELAKIIVKEPIDMHRGEKTGHVFTVSCEFVGTLCQSGSKAFASTLIFRMVFCTRR